MCGIFGWVLPARRMLNERTLVELTDSMRHRGPDASGYQVFSSRSGKWQVALGHRRLSILDLTPLGNQPMYGADGSIIIFNGEIYNYVELREEIESSGGSLKSCSDTEVLLNLLLRHGRSIIPKLRGMFAFAFWDGVREELTLARDQFGKKPLYVAKLDGGFVFGSELYPLTRFPGLDGSIDWDSVPEFLEYRYVPGPNTFYRNIKKLPPAHLATWDGGELSTERFFTPPFARSAEITDENDVVRNFTKALKQAVSIRLRSDAPFGAFLSGGIDSATIVGLMTQELSRPIKTFSVGFEEEHFSELKYARKVANHFKAEHTEIIVPAEAVIDHLPEAVLRRGAPVSEPSDVPILLLSKAASQSVKVVLTGEGSDELLGGYPKHWGDRLITRYQSLVPSSLHDAIVSPLARHLPYSARRAAIFLRVAGERDLRSRMSAWFGATTVQEREALLKYSKSERCDDYYPLSSEASGLKRVLFFDQTSWLPDNLLERGDRMMMAGSIEGRMPFMDVELAELVASLPDRYLLHWGTGKVILRQSMKAILPREVITRKKVGFRVPVNVWFRSSLKDFLLDHIMGPSSITSQFYKSSAVEAIASDHLNGRYNHEKLLWALLNLEMFVRQFKPGLGSGPNSLS